MGDYEPMTHPDPSIPESEYDNNFSTVDPSFLEPVSLYYIRSLEVIYALDNFILTELSGSTFIPEITATPDAATFPE